MCVCVHVWVHVYLPGNTMWWSNYSNTDFVETRQGLRILFCSSCKPSYITSCARVFVLEIQTRTLTKVVCGGLIRIIWIYALLCINLFPYWCKVYYLILILSVVWVKQWTALLKKQDCKYCMRLLIVVGFGLSLQIQLYLYGTAPWQHWLGTNQAQKYL